jgi:PAS domain S-box-containing protein
MAEVVLGRIGKKKLAAATRVGSLRKSVLTALLVGTAYFLTAKIGFAFALQPGSVSTLWLPNSILLAALLLTPERSWWIVIAAVFPAHVASELNSGVPFSMVLSWFLSNSTQALIGAFCLRRFTKGPTRLDSFRNFTAFVVFGVFLAPFLSSFLDIALVKLNGWGNDAFWHIWRIRFLANVVASLTVVPVIITWVNGGLESILHASYWRYIEASLLAIGLIVVSTVVFRAQLLGTDGTPLLYFPLPFLLWAAVRFGLRGTSTALLIVLFIAVWGAMGESGPFVSQSAAGKALSIQWLLIVVSIPLMSLTAVIQERERAQQESRTNEEQLAMALEAAQMGTFDWNVTTNETKWSDQTKRIFGLSETDTEVPPDEFYLMLHPDDREMVKGAINRAISEGTPYEAEFRMPQPDGSLRWVRVTGRVLQDNAGRPFRMTGLNADITQRKQSEQLLRESEARLARTEAFSLVMSTHVSLDGSWLKVPPTLCELLGYTEEELLNSSFKDVTHSEDFEFEWNECQRLIRGEIKSFDLEKRYIHKNGGTVWVYVNCSVVEDEYGRPVHFLTYIRDITNQKSAEEALRRSEDEYRKVVESQTELICRFLPDTTLTYVNDAYCRYFSKTREELVGSKYIELVPEEVRDFIQEQANILVRNPGTRTNEHEVILPDGTIGWQQWVDHAITSRDGKVLELLAIGRDITDRKRAEQAAHETAERNRAILRAIPDMVFLLDRDGVYLDFHTRDLSSLMVQPDIFLGKNVRDVLPPDLAAQVLECVRLAALTDEPQVMEYSLPIDGVDRHYEARLIGMDGGRVLSIVRDITDARLASEALSKSEEELRQSNRQISALAGRLITAQEAERMRISRQLHDDLSQKIATLSVGISKLKRSLPATDAKLRAELDQLRSQTNDLTTDLRRLSHQLHPAVLDHLGLVSALESYITEFRNEEQIDVQLQTKIAGKGIPLETSVCLYRVAVEALRNVARHSGAKTATISLNEEDEFLRLEVSDSGRGFDPSKAARGSGLGLVSAEERVRLLKGTFEVKSTPTMGTTLVSRVPWVNES